VTKKAKTQQPMDLSKDEGYSEPDWNMKRINDLHDLTIKIIKHLDPVEGHPLLVWVSWCIDMLSEEEDLTDDVVSLVGKVYFGLLGIVNQATANCECDHCLQRSA
jgi:hypothetical protein